MKKIIQIIISFSLVFTFNANASIFDWFTYPGQKNKKVEKKIDEKGQEIVQDLGPKSIDKKLLKNSRCTSLFYLGAPILPDNLKDDAIFLCKKDFEIVYLKNKNKILYTSEVLNKINANKKDDNLKVDVVLDFDKTIPYEMQKKPDNNFVYLVNPKHYYYNNVAYQGTAIYTNTVNLKLKTSILWNSLQNWTYEQSKKRDILQINNGLLYLNNEKENEITHIYSAIVDPTIKEAIVFIIPNSNNIKGRDCENENCNIFSFTTNLVELEKLTNIHLHKNSAANSAMRYKVSDKMINFDGYKSN